MDTTTPLKPKTMAELLPCLRGILTKDAVRAITAKTQPRRTTEIDWKPLTIAEMRAYIQGNSVALSIQSPRRCAQTTTSNKKKKWNSSVKIEKKIGHPANGKLKKNPVRKVLNFQPGTKITTNSRMTINKHNQETPKFAEPEFPAKKSLHQQACDMIRISGVSNISETPNIMNKPNKPRRTPAVKENISKNANLIRKPLTLQIVLNHKLLNKPTVPDSLLSNESWNSILMKTKVTYTENSNTELETLIKNEKQIEDHIKVIENAIQNLQDIKTSRIISLKSLRKLINEIKNSKNLLNEHDKTLTNVDDVTLTPVKNEKTSPEKSHTISKPCSVIKTLKSPSYKIPKKNLCLRKKVFHKSMANMLTPNKNMQDS